MASGYPERLPDAMNAGVLKRDNENLCKTNFWINP